MAIQTREITGTEAAVAVDLMRPLVESAESQLMDLQRKLALRYTGTGTQSWQPLVRASSLVSVYARMAKLGAKGGDLIAKINLETQNIGAPDITPYTANSRISSALKLISRRITLFDEISYAFSVANSEKAPTDLQWWRRFGGSKKGAAAIAAFAQLLPPDYKKMCDDTAQLMREVSKLAEQQEKKAKSVVEGFKKEYQPSDKQLLAEYARQYNLAVGNAKKFGQERRELRDDFMAHAMKPDETRTEGKLAESTLNFTEALEAQAKYLSLFFHRTSALTMGSDAATYTALTSFATGQMPLLYVNRLGLFLVNHFNRMICCSLLALAVAVGDKTEEEAKAIFSGVAAEDASIQRAITGA